MIWAYVFGMFLIAAGSLAVGVIAADQIRSRFTSSPGTHSGPRPVNGRSLPDQPRQKSLVTPAQAVAHADVMNAPPRLSYSRADLPVTRKPTDDDAPWDIPTGVQPVLTEEMIREREEMARQRERAEWIESQLPENPSALSDEDLQRAMASAMVSVSAIPAPHPTWNEAPQLEVEAAERLADAS